MIKKLSKFLIGDEVLAIDIVNESNVILIPEKTILDDYYINKLKELKIEYVYIESELCQEEKEIINNCVKLTKNLIEKYFSNASKELLGLRSVVESIIEEVLNRPDILFNVNNIRHNSEDLYQHSVNVCAISVFIGAYMKVSSNELSEIAVGGLLHDIGYCYVDSLIKNNMISDEMLEKERKKHVIYGFSMLENEISKYARDIVLSHHEREDGSGYPFRKRGYSIKKGSKIVAVSDEFDNIINKKNTKIIKIYEAIEEIVNNAGRKFDTDVVDIFRKNIYVYPVGSIVKTNEGEIGVVKKQNEKFPTRPVIKILKDKNNNCVINDIAKDLTKELTLFIEDTIE